MPNAFIRGADLRFFCGLIRLFVFAGLVIVRPVCANSLLGEWTLFTDAGTVGTYDSTSITLRGWPLGSDAPFDPPAFELTFAGGRLFTPADVGFTSSLDAGNTPGFTALTGLLSNGTDDTLLMGFFGGGGYGATESSFFTPAIALPGGAIDLHGHVIDRLQFTLDSFTLTSAEGWTDYALQFRLSAYSLSSVPEPSTCTGVAGIAAIALAATRRRRAR